MQNSPRQSLNELNGSAPSREELIETLEWMDELERRQRRRRIDNYFPDEGPYRRELYPKHLAFFAAGATEPERAIIAANRIGKTESVGCYELSCHLTGQYPEWWPGRRFDHPIQAWAAGDTGETTRDILQAALFGPVGIAVEEGTGMIPGDAIISTVGRPNVPQAIQKAEIKHVSGGTSHLGLKSYDQKRKSFQGTQKHVILLDEECAWDVYEECLLRTTATGEFGGGLIMCTFTPLLGMSEVVMHYLGMNRGDDDAAA